MTTATTEIKIWVALKTQVETMATDMGLTVAFPKLTYDPPSNGGIPSDYLICDFVPNINARLYQNTGGAHNRQGILTISVMTPINGVVDRDIQLAGIVASWFPDDLALRFDGLKTTITKQPDTSAGYRDGGYWRTPVSISWQAFG